MFQKCPRDQRKKMAKGQGAWESPTPVVMRQALTKQTNLKQNEAEGEEEESVNNEEKKEEDEGEEEEDDDDE